MDHPFRSAALGGFNKQDVLSFLEEQSKQSAQAQQWIQGQLDEANRQVDISRREGEEARQQLEEVRRELELAAQERDSMRARAEQAEQSLSASDSRTVQTARELE